MYVCLFLRKHSLRKKKSWRNQMTLVLGCGPSIRWTFLSNESDTLMSWSWPFNLIANKWLYSPLTHQYFWCVNLSYSLVTRLSHGGLTQWDNPCFFRSNQFLLLLLHPFFVVCCWIVYPKFSAYWHHCHSFCYLISNMPLEKKNQKKQKTKRNPKSLCLPIDVIFLFFIF